MVRRMQLLEAERGFSGRRAAELGARIREGLLRDNKVVPPVLAVLALLIFAWLAAGVFMGQSAEEEEQRASNQASLGQTPEEDLDVGDPETPAPEAENRDADSFAAFEPKDPFRELIPKAESKKAGESKSKAGESKAESKAGESKSKTGESKSKASESKSKTGGSESKANGARSKADEGKAGDDFIDQSFPGGVGSRGGGAGGDDPDSGADQGGSGNLFNSGGDLALPLPAP